MSIKVNIIIIIGTYKRKPLFSRRHIKYTSITNW